MGKLLRLTLRMQQTLRMAAATAAVVTLGDIPDVTASAKNGADNSNISSRMTDVTLVTYVPGGEREITGDNALARVTIREIRHPAISAGPDDNLDDLTV